jgi:hypothetical protein
VQQIIDYKSYIKVLYSVLFSVPSICFDPQRSLPCSGSKQIKLVLKNTHNDTQQEAKVKVQYLCLPSVTLILSQD